LFKTPPVGECNAESVSVYLPADFGRLPNDAEIAIFRVIQECLTNIHRHSGSATGRDITVASGWTFSRRSSGQWQGNIPGKTAGVNHFRPHGSWFPGNARTPAAIAGHFGNPVGGQGDGYPCDPERRWLTARQHARHVGFIRRPHLPAHLALWVNAVLAWESLRFRWRIRKIAELLALVGDDAKPPLSKAYRRASRKAIPSHGLDVYQVHVPLFSG
jgi:hypothetical protein